MRSRTIVILSISLLIVLIGVGGAALGAVLAPYSTPPPGASAAGYGDKPAHEEGFVPERTAAEASLSAVGALDAGVRPTASSEPLPLTEPREARADTLRYLLRNVQRMFPPGSSEVNASMIPHLAEIIALLNNQPDTHAYRFVIVEESGRLAARRAETLAEMLQLNLLYPDNVVLEGREGSQHIVIDFQS